jgi:hypothetical protein
MCFWNNQTDGHKYYRKIIPAVFNSIGDNKHIIPAVFNSIGDSKQNQNEN